MAVEPLPEFHHVLVAPTHQNLLDEFTCKESKEREVARFLRTKALVEQRHGTSKTTLFLTDPVLRCDGFVTLSAASLELASQDRADLGGIRKWVPAVMIDWIGVHTVYDGKGVGHVMFRWVEKETLAARRNTPIGIRLLFLAVRAGSWKVFQHYADVWGFTPLPLPVDPEQPDSEHRRPDPRGERPVWMAEDRFINMYYDLLKRRPVEPPAPT